LRTNVAVAAAVMVLVAAAADGQSPADSTAHFEVASVKTAASPFAPAPGGGPSKLLFGVRALPGGRLVAVASLQMLILRAYGIKEYQLEGGPAWLSTDYFDISAKAEQETATEADLNAMLRSLLAERFGLRVHVETRQASVHTLTVARADRRLGSGMKPTSRECETAIEERKKSKTPLSRPSGPPTPGVPICGLTTERSVSRGGTNFLTMGGQPMSMLVARISSDLMAPVVDQTGLAGLFDVTLEFEPTPHSPARLASGLDPNGTDPLPVPLPAALQQQLGLKLEKGTGPLPITIIDAAEPPSPN
jgi:uncharacterized protein (TIGR03435 family)